MVPFDPSWVTNLVWHKWCILDQITLCALVLDMLPQYTELTCKQTDVKAIVLFIVIVDDLPGDDQT